MEPVTSALCVVAHPDDCVIFGLGLIHHTPSWRWHIVYVTYHDRDPRAQEISAFWQRRHITTQFLGHEDRWQDLESGRCSFDVEQADQDIHTACQHADRVVTHNPDGEYGHPHHVFVAGTVLRHRPDTAQFARPGQGTHEFLVPPECYDTSELPLHGDMVRSFHTQAHRNHYVIPKTWGLETSA